MCVLQGVFLGRLSSQESQRMSQRLIKFLVLKVITLGVGGGGEGRGGVDTPV